MKRITQIGKSEVGHMRLQYKWPKTERKYDVLRPLKIDSSFVGISSPHLYIVQQEKKT